MRRKSEVAAATAPALLAIGGLALLAFTARTFGLSTAHDVFVDEATYARLGTSVASGQIVPTLFGHFFYLHPPVFFWIIGLVELVVGDGSSVLALVLHLRVVNVILSCLTCLVVIGIGRRLGGSVAGGSAGLIAALLMAADPFLIEYDGLVLLETAAALFAMLGWLVLLRGMDDHDRVPCRTAVWGGILVWSGTSHQGDDILPIRSGTCGRLPRRHTDWPSLESCSPWCGGLGVFGRLGSPSIRRVVVGFRHAEARGIVSIYRYAENHWVQGARSAIFLGQDC